MCLAGHKWRDLEIVGEHVQRLWGSGGANPIVKSALGHTFGAQTPCPNPLWCSYTNNTDTQAFCSPRVQSANSTKPAWDVQVTLPVSSHIYPHISTSWVVLEREGRCELGLRMTDKEREGWRATASEREGKKDDEIISIGMRFAPVGQILLRL